MKKILCTVCVISIFSTTNIIFAQDQHVIVQPQKTPPANNKTKSKEDEMQALQQTGKRLPPGLSVTKMVAEEYAKSGNLPMYKFETAPALNKATKEEVALKESQKAGYGNPNDLPSIPGYNNQKKAGGNGYQQLQLTPNEKFQNDGRYQPLMPLPKESTYDVVQPVQNNNSSSNLSPNNQSSLKGNTQTLKNNQYDNVHSPLNQYEVVPPLQGGQYNALPKEASDAHNNNPQFGKVPPPQDQQYTKLPPLQKEYNALPNEALNVHNNNPQFGKVPPPQDQQYTKLPPLQKEYNALPNEALNVHNNNPQFGKVPPPQDQQYTKLPPPQDQQYTKLPPPQDQQYGKLPPPPGEQPNNNGYTLAPAKNNEYGPVPALKEEAINNEKSGYTRAPAAPANKNINNSKSVNGAVPQNYTTEATPARILAEKKDKNELEKVELVKVEKTEQEILKAKLEEEKRVLEEKKKKEEEDKRALEEKKKKEEEEAAAKKKREEEEQKKLQNQHKPKPES